MPEIDGVEIEVGGQAFAEFEVPSSEALGIGFAIIILIIAFGSVLAMGLPIGVALAGIFSGTLIAGLLSQVINMPEFTSTIGVMIGLGVGIDYALLIVTRFRRTCTRATASRPRRSSPWTPLAEPCCSPARQWSSRCWAC